MKMAELMAVTCKSPFRTAINASRRVPASLYFNDTTMFLLALSILSASIALMLTAVNLSLTGDGLDQQFSRLVNLFDGSWPA